MWRDWDLALFLGIFVDTYHITPAPANITYIHIIYAAATYVCDTKIKERKRTFQSLFPRTLPAGSGMAGVARK